MADKGKLTVHISDGAAFALCLIALAAALIVRSVLRAAAVKRQGYALEPRPSEIQAALQAVPLMQQPRARKAYLGMGVRWQVTFKSVIVLGPLSVRLMLLDRGSYPWVLCDVRKSKYPQLNSLTQHSPLWVSGHISKTYGDEITLKNARLEFEE